MRVDGMEWERCPEHGPKCYGPVQCCCKDKHPFGENAQAPSKSAEFLEFVTHDSGERIDYPSGMRRDTTKGKLRYDLIPLFFLKRLAGLYTRGAEKYGDNNWQLANSEEEYKRFKASAFRHFVQWLDGERDEDHAAAVVFNLAAAEHVHMKLTAE